MSQTTRNRVGILAFVLFLYGCGGGASGGSSADVPDTPASPASPSDTTAPAVQTRLPADTAVDVAITTVVEVTFDEALDPASVDQDSLMLSEQGVRLTATVEYDTTSRVLQLAPAAALATDTVYEVTLASGLADAAGNTTLGETWFFTTGGPFNLGSTSQSTIDQCMDDDDKQLLTLVNNARANDRDCGTDAMPAQGALAWDCMLDQAASGHSTSMANNDFHAHVSPVDGTDPGDRIIAAGYDPVAWGENIAGGQQTEEEVMDAWLNSPGHCSNIMNSAFTELGAAKALNPASTFGIYWTQNFGRPRD